MRVMSILVSGLFAYPAFAGSNAVLVELFTSEGCSSCPSADAVLSTMEDRDDVALLGWHVDYWDYLGWKDRFGHEVATPRQRAYGAALARGRVYTPQMVINGETEFVGSNRSTAERTIAKAAKDGGVPIRISAKAEENLSGTIAIGDGIDSKNAKAYLAITEDNLISSVTRGENAGKTLRHDGVVRDVYELGSVSGGAAERSFEAPLNSDWAKDQLKVVVWVQDTKTLKVFGAATAKVK